MGKNHNRKPKKPAEFYLPIYGMNYAFFIGFSPAEFVSVCEKKLGQTLDIGNERGKTFLVDCKQFMICLIYVNDKKDIVTIAHECLHAANFTLDNVGISISTDNDEVQTYLLDSIFEQALNTVKK